jgi:hemolysin III
MKTIQKNFSKGEEIANSITHGIGVLLSIAALVLLIIYSSENNNAWEMVTFIIYGVTMVLLYSSSTLLHSFPDGKAKNIFEIMDHSAIYFFIAGSYTPILLLVIKGTLGWTLLGVIWFLAIGGTIFKAFFVKKYIVLSTVLYVVMGWLIVFAWNPLIENLSKEAILLLVISGLLYTLGSIFYMWRGFKYHHAVWHLFVVAGSVIYFFFILFHVI